MNALMYFYKRNQISASPKVSELCSLSTEKVAATLPAQDNQWSRVTRV